VPGWDDANTKEAVKPLEQALRGAMQPPPAQPPPRTPQGPHSVLLVGAGGALGSALLAECLVSGRFSAVLALVAEPLSSALRGFVPVQQQALLAPRRADTQPLADVAVLVLERARHSNGRDDAFVQANAKDWLTTAKALYAHGVRHLVVVVPHAPALMPQALAHGLASADEAAVAALGFMHVVLVRAARPADAPPAAPSWLHAAAAWWLAQLRYMVPQQDQPLRAVVLARCVAELLRLLPHAPAGTRVLAPQTLWPMTQHANGLAQLPLALHAWLHSLEAPNPQP
jgi:hypothetical protein